MKNYFICFSPYLRDLIYVTFGKIFHYVLQKKIYTTVTDIKNSVLQSNLTDMTTGTTWILRVLNICLYTT